MNATREPVVIVGAGPVGVACALLLARRGVATVILERYPTAYELPRGVHLDDEVFRILQALGVDRRFARVSRPMPGMRLIDGRGRVMAEFARDIHNGRNGFPPDSMFDQPDLERILLDEAAQVDLIDLRRGCEVTELVGGRRPILRYTDAGGRQQVIAAAAVVACDGANSTIRDQLGIDMRDYDFDEQWLVIDVRTRTPLDVWGGVHQICDPRRAATFMQVTGNRYRWEFQVHDGENLEELLRPERLRDLLAPWMTPAQLDESEILRRSFYTFRARVAKTWRVDRVFLAGDAAHQTPPFVGQGLGSGFRDVLNLSWKLADVLDGTAPEWILDTYESERRPHATRIVLMALAVGWALTGGQDRLATPRRLVLAGICRIPGLSAIMPAGTPPLRRGPLVGGRGLRHRLNGRLFPQPWIHTADGDRRLDDVLGTNHTLFTRGPLAPAAAARVADADILHIDVDAISCLPSTTTSPAALMRKRRVHAVLVRPDRVVAASTATAAGVSDLVATHDRARIDNQTGVSA